MTAVMRKKKVSLKVESSLYSLLETQAGENGECLTDLVLRLLSESMEGWGEYCETVRKLADDEDRPVRLCVKD